MAQTPISAAAPYCTQTQALTFLDARLIGDLVRTDGTRATVSALGSDTTFLAALAAASGKIESACFRGQRYTAADLAALTGNGLSFLQRLTANLSLGILYGDRFPAVPDPTQVAEAKKDLERLANGEAIFAFAESAAAGVLSDQYETWADRQARGLNTERARRSFGHRGHMGPCPSW